MLGDVLKTGVSAKIALLILLGFTLFISSSETFDWNKIKNSANKILKSSGIAAIIRKAAPEINSFINKITLNQGVKTRETTKVVPLFSVGNRTAAGGVQVSGPAELLKQVRAAFQIDGNFNRGKLRVRVFVPSTSSTKLVRVHGVGVSALVDYHVR
tara:strand:- start:885 stop:1352 length:468 start_codon:yes stop_codon:yes gene_type:complete